MRTWMEIDLEQIRRNYRAILQKKPDGVEILAVLKADAYGLGAVRIGHVLEEEGCKCFAVTFQEEAEELREAGIEGTILVTAPAVCETAFRQDLIYSIDSEESACALSAGAMRSGIIAEAHVKVDTGLGRLGFSCQDLPEESEQNKLYDSLDRIRRIAAMPGIRITGLYTHITAARGADGDRLNRRQLNRFREIAEQLEEGGLKLATHCLSTFPLVQYPEYAGDAARVGALLFGASGAGNALYGDYPVDSCAALRTKICAVKTLPKGSTVSYGPTYTAASDIRAAVVPIGFADGFPRSLSNKWSMLLNGKEVPIIGKITCDYTILDVTAVETAAVGDTVTVFGEDHGAVRYPGACAAAAGMSVSELTAVLHTRIPRIYSDEMRK